MATKFHLAEKNVDYLKKRIEISDSYFKMNYNSVQ